MRVHHFAILACPLVLRPLCPLFLPSPLCHCLPIYLFSCVPPSAPCPVVPLSPVPLSPVPMFFSCSAPLSRCPPVSCPLVPGPLVLLVPASPVPCVLLFFLLPFAIAYLYLPVLPCPSFCPLSRCPPVSCPLVPGPPVLLLPPSPVPCVPCPVVPLSPVPCFFLCPRSPSLVSLVLPPLPCACTRSLFSVVSSSACPPSLVSPFVSPSLSPVSRIPTSLAPCILLSSVSCVPCSSRSALVMVVAELWSSLCLSCAFIIFSSFLVRLSPVPAVLHMVCPPCSRPSLFCSCPALLVPCCPLSLVPVVVSSPLSPVPRCSARPSGFLSFLCPLVSCPPVSVLRYLVFCAPLSSVPCVLCFSRSALVVVVAECSKSLSSVPLVRVCHFLILPCARLCLWSWLSLCF